VGAIFSLKKGKKKLAIQSGYGSDSKGGAGVTRHKELVGGGGAREGKEKRKIHGLLLPSHKGG